MRHRIQRQQFLLTLPPAIDAFRAQQAAGRYFHEQLLPMLEAIFDELSTGDEVWHLDSCQIDLGVLDLASLYDLAAGETIYQRLRAEVKRVIDHELTTRPHLRRSAALKAWDTWRYYMDKGYLPWNGDPPDHEDLQQVLAHLAVDYEAVSWLRRALQPAAPMLTRVVAQHDDEFLTQLVTVLTATRQPELSAVVRAVTRLLRMLEVIRAGAEGTGAAAPTPLAISLTLWAARSTQFRHAPQTQQSSILWQQLLAAAAARPADLARHSVIELLLQDLEDETPLLEIALTSPGGDDEKAIRPWLLAAWDRAKSRESATEDADDDAPDTRDTMTPMADRDPAAGAPREKTRPDTTAKTDLRDTNSEPPAVSPANDQTKAPTPHPDPQPPPGTPAVRAGNRTTGADTNRQTGPEPAIPEDEGIYVTAAGLILIYPFLSTLLYRAGYWNGAAFKNMEARQQAVFLTYWLATGDQHAPEHALAFPKILCGYPLEEPLPREWELAPAALEEAGVMLENVVARWEKLGNTTITGLREGFLQRGGKLAGKDGRLTLQMETSGIDVLLDYLPWNIGIVKLPWWKQILYVEWR
jgi:hypothetical protein